MMNDHQAGRRAALKVFAGLPWLPAIASLPFSAQAHAAVSGPIAAVTFKGMAAPGLAQPAAMASVSADSLVALRSASGKSRNMALRYQALFLTGELLPDGRGGQILAGGCFDIQGQPIRDASHPGQAQFYSDCPDGSSLLAIPNARVEGVQGRPLFLVVQFEYTSRNAKGESTYGMLPSPMAVVTLDQDPKTGALKVLRYANVDTSAAHGLWITCGASRTPWNTHLSSEEYEPDAFAVATDKRFRAFSTHLYGDPTRANPYHYGHMPEVTVKADGSASLRKHYCMGRLSHELAQVMPDGRTALMGDDASNGGLFMFVADRARDLSSGTLYVARWHQESAANGGSAKLSWIRLGHAGSSEIEALAGRVQPGDIMDVARSDPQDASYTRIPYLGKSNWVRLKPGQEQAAAFLETRRMAALQGASMGFTKMEGVTVSARERKAWVAISAIQTSMRNKSGGIAVEGPQAGAVYQLDLQGRQRDTSGQLIASDWVPVNMAAVPELLGADLAAPDALGNLADPQRVASPDNIKYSEAMRTLFIGEDSGMHVNNFVWAFNIDTRQLSRVLSCPVGAEATGLHAVDEMNGFTYIVSHFQHAGDWELKRDAEGNISGGLHARVMPVLDPLVRANYRERHAASVGYLTFVPVG